jgi:DNA-binding beta-propeller fold protein YncE
MLTAGVPAPLDLALDVEGGKIYWIRGDRLQVADLDATHVTDLVIDLDSPWRLALDLRGGKIYWTETGRVRRASLDGSEVEDLATGLVEPRGIAFDHRRGRVYWTEYFGCSPTGCSGLIRCVATDGSEVVDLVRAEGESLAIAWRLGESDERMHGEELMEKIARLLRAKPEPIQGSRVYRQRG